MGTFVLRPYDTSGDWISFGSGQLNDELDTTYKYFQSLYQYGIALVNIASIPWDANIAIKSLRVRARIASSTGSPVYTQVTVFTGTGRVLISQGDSYQLLHNGTSFVEVATGQRVASLLPSEGPVQVIFHPVSGDPSINSPEISEVYLDVEFIYPPIPTLNYPTGTYTTTSGPGFSFTFFSQDSLAQTAYRYLIYTSAQVAASGFIPGTTVPEYDSGIVYSSAKTGYLKALPNGSYRVYFAVAQTVNGALQWSLWTNPSNTTYKDYTLNITPPAAPTVTATADDVNARIELTVTGAGAANSVQDLYQLERSLDAGVTWEQVRGDNSSGYIDSVGGVRQWHDYETANGESVVYRARTITYDTLGNVLVGAYSSNSSSVAWSSTSTWLKVITDPSLNRTIIVRAFGDEGYDVPMGTFQGLDSDEVVTVSGVRRARPDSTFTILVQTLAEREAIQSILALGVPILVQAGSRSSGWAGESKYLQVGRVIVSRPTRAGWSHLRDVTMPYTEVDRPDPEVFLVSFGTNTWQDISDTYATFTALNAAFTTYGDIRG